MPTKTTIQEALKHYPGVETDLLLAHILKKPKEFVYLNPKKLLTAQQLSKFKRIAKRRLEGEPVAYLLGYKWFFGRKFLVNKHVLVPRGSSEWLVERTVSNIKATTAHMSPRTEEFTRLRRGVHALKNGFRPSGRNDNVKILDMATGSGCIAISIALSSSDFLLGLPLARRVTRGSMDSRLRGNDKKITITASDISQKALAVARSNARLHKTKLKFIQSDLFAKISGKFHIITANLPYVPKADYKKLLEGLKYEPKLAVTEGNNTFQLYKKFLQQARQHLLPGGTILLEMDPKTKPYISKWAKQYFPKAKLSFHKDWHKLWRYAEITTLSKP